MAVDFIFREANPAFLWVFVQAILESITKRTARIQIKRPAREARPCREGCRGDCGRKSCLALDEAVAVVVARETSSVITRRVGGSRVFPQGAFPVSRE